MGIRIKGTGMFVPPQIRTNADLEKMVDTSDEWITSRTGIRERRIASADIQNSDMALEAARRALDMAGISPEELDIITIATVSGDQLLPNTACILQRKLGAKNSICFDVSAACSGLLYSLEIVHDMLVANKKFKKALVLGSEKLSNWVDWTDRSTCVLFGDGASALVLEKNDQEPDDFYVSVKLCADGQYAGILSIPAGGTAMPPSAETMEKHLQFIKMGGQETFKLAVTGMASACTEVLSSAGVSLDQIAWIVPHQANLRIINAVAGRLNAPPEKVFKNIEKYGNTSSASIGICLDEMNRGGLIKRGDYVLLTTFGAGLTWGAGLIRW